MAKRAAKPSKRAKFGGIFENKLRRISRLGRFNSQKYSLTAKAGYVLLKVDTGAGRCGRIQLRAARRRAIQDRGFRIGRGLRPAPSGLRHRPPGHSAAI